MASVSARAFWITTPGFGEIRSEELPGRLEGQVLVRAQYSGVSRGTEALVFNGHVPPSEWQRMRAPFQEGDFPGPVKYGYASVGVVEDGPESAVGRRVFVLYPHQDRYVVPLDAAHFLPDAVPSARAVLAANAETALNAVWDAELRPGQSVTVIGAGVVGSLVAWLAKTVEECDVTLVDKYADRRKTADALGVKFQQAPRAPSADVVMHASGSADGLNLALSAANFEGTVVEISWYGDREVPVRLGESFHSQRLTLKSSQVGAVAASRRADWSMNRRLERAIDLLAEPALDALVTDETPFEQLPRVMARLATAPPETLCHRIRYV